jgi:hypothetical protein
VRAVRVMTVAGRLLASVILTVGGVQLGLWWAPFMLGFLLGVLEPRSRVAVPAGATIGLLGWLLPLAWLGSRYGLGPTAESLSAILGFGHQAAVPVFLTLLVGTLLGLTGAWLGSAGRSALSPQGRGLGRGA